MSDMSDESNWREPNALEQKRGLAPLYTGRVGSETHCTTDRGGRIVRLRYVGGGHSLGVCPGCGSLTVPWRGCSWCCHLITNRGQAFEILHDSSDGST